MYWKRDGTSIHHFRRGHKQTAQIEQTVDVVEFQFIKYFLFIRVEGITKELPQKAIFLAPVIIGLPSAKMD